MKQRGIFSITTLILLALQKKPQTKTRLMQEVMLSYNRIGYYCDFLMRQGLIEYDQANRRYVITSRGAEVVRLAEELAGYLRPLDQMIKKYTSYTSSPYQYYLDHSINNDSHESKNPSLHHVL
ncbi:MAG: winged helix-turn-helix domain-containing protein [Thermoproteota archaeon]|nr:winged helix-turn-helix domain-containing protein [Thermoproteota archaeon]